MVGSFCGVLLISSILLAVKGVTIDILEVLSRFGPLIGSFVGAAAPISAAIIKFNFDKRKEQKSIRRAFLADLKSTQIPIKNALITIQTADDSVDNLDVEAVNILTSPIAEGLFNQVGRLPSDESYALVEYYRLLKTTVEVLKELEEGSGSSDISAQEQVRALLNKNKEIISTLEDKVD